MYNLWIKNKLNNILYFNDKILYHNKYLMRNLTFYIKKEKK